MLNEGQKMRLMKLQKNKNKAIVNVKSKKWEEERLIILGLQGKKYRE